MMTLVVQMLRARRGQALTILLLSVFATGAAVAGPAALAAVDRAIIRHEVGAADVRERTMTLASVGSEGVNDADEFARFLPLILNLRGFQQVYATEFTIIGIAPLRDLSHLSRMAFREDVCAHLTMVSGRCVMSSYEIILGEQTARRYGLRPGTILSTDEVEITETGAVLPRGNPRDMMVVGVYRPTDPTDLYWGQLSYFRNNLGGDQAEPVFTGRRTAGFANSGVQSQSLDTILPADLLTPSNLDDVRSSVEAIEDSLTNSGGAALSFSTAIPDLLTRIQDSREVAHTLAPVAFIPLVALCLFVIYLAVSYGTVGRRHELGLVTLRGVTRSRRWWLTASEPVAMILLGAPIGYLVGHLAVVAIARYGFGDATGAGPATRTLPYAIGVVLAAVAVSLLAQRRELATPVAELLRRVPARVRGLRGALVEVLLVVAAVVAVVQLRGLGTGLGGVASLVPGLVIASVAVIAARAVAPLAGAVGRIALHRGRLGWALSALHLARRPGSHRLLILLTVATALLGFAVAGLDVGTRARHERAAVETGTSTVVTLRSVDARTLLNAVRRVDPAGAYAMAVARTPADTPDESPAYAVDSTRLGAAAVWREEFGVGPAEVAALLRPSAPESFVLRAEEITLDLDYLVRQSNNPPRQVVAVFGPLAGGAPVEVSTGPLLPGRHTYTREAPGCAAGCRLGSIRIASNSPDLAEVTVYGVRQRTGDDESTTPVVPPAALADTGRWHSTGDTRVGVSGDGLTIRTWPGQGLSGVLVRDMPVPLPVVMSKPSLPVGGGVTGLDRGRYDAVLAGRARLLPRVGSNGLFMDLEYLDRSSLVQSPLTAAEVWLGPAAPPDAVARLRDAGLPVAEVYGVERHERALAGQGSSLVLWFYLVAAAFAVILALGGIGLMAAVDHRRRADDLRYLRWQGLSRRDMRRASLWGSLGVVLSGGVLGLGATWLAWLVAGDALPIFVDDQVTVAPPRWPAAEAVLWPWAASVVLIVAVAVVASVQVHRAVAGNGRRTA
jgi:hypothetical protein